MLAGGDFMRGIWNLYFHEKQPVTGCLDRSKIFVWILQRMLAEKLLFRNAVV